MAWALFGRIFGDDQIVDRSSKSIGAFEVYDSSEIVRDTMNPIKVLATRERDLRAWNK
jgi:hypothetical protein